MGYHWNKRERSYLLSRLAEALAAKYSRQVIWHEGAQEKLTPSQAFRYSVIVEMKHRFSERFEPTSSNAWSTYRVATLDCVSGSKVVQIVLSN